MKGGRRGREAGEGVWDESMKGRRRGRKAGEVVGDGGGSDVKGNEDED
jgi:hypothetical protein